MALKKLLNYQDRILLHPLLSPSHNTLGIIFERCSKLKSLKDKIFITVVVMRQNG